MSVYIHESVSEKKISEFLKNQRTVHQTEIHSFQFYKGDTLLAKVAVPPYSANDKGQIYSLSKSFASTAIGIACDMGLVSVNDRIIDIFPEEAPQNPSENLSKMTLHHVLSMNTGHENCVMPLIANSDNGVKAFLEAPVKFTPGTHFTYNTGATYMLSAIIKKVTKMSLFDFLFEKLWLPLGISPQRWQTCGGDINEGGIGLFVSCDDIAKLGRLYLNKGIYEGKRILSEKWITEAQKPHTDNSGNGTVDWTSGYGYQFWKCFRGGYRGDGAFGQFCVIIPEKDIVFAAITETKDMQSSLNGIFDLIENYENDGTDSDISVEFETAKMYPPYESETAFVKGTKEIYRLKENLQGFTLAMPSFEDNKFILNLSDGEKIQTITAGNGKWILNRISAKSFKPILTDLAPYLREDTSEFYASYKVEGEKVFVDMRYINCPHRIEMTVEFTGGKIKLRLICPDRLIYENGLVIES